MAEMATSETGFDGIDVIKNDIENLFLSSSEDYTDRVKTAGFTDDGWARASVVFDTCVSEQQTKEIRESEVWTIESIHPQYGGDGVALHLIEQH